MAGSYLAQPGDAFLHCCDVAHAVRACAFSEEAEFLAAVARAFAHVRFSCHSAGMRKSSCPSRQLATKWTLSIPCHVIEPACSVTITWNCPLSTVMNSESAAKMRRTP